MAAGVAITLLPMTLKAMNIASVPLCIPISMPMAIACDFPKFSNRGIKYPTVIHKTLKSSAGTPTKEK